jgi:hypothetical protein
MDFVKKHYEKIILIAVLLAVVGFLVFLPIMIAADQDDLDRMRNEVVTPKVIPLPELDLARQENISKRLQSPTNFDFSTKNKLFNPLDWKKDANGVMFPIKNGNEIGPRAAVVTKISPLYLVVTLDSVETNAAQPRYVISFEHQAAPTSPLRGKQRRYVSMDDKKKDLFTLVSVKGDPLNPDELDLKLADTGVTVPVLKDKPFERVDAYAADLKYDPEKKNFAERRAGSVISFNGEDYIIVAIDANAVILSSQSNQKKYTLPYAP